MRGADIKIDRKENMRLWTEFKLLMTDSNC